MKCDHGNRPFDMGQLQNPWCNQPLNNQHDWGNLYDHLMSQKTLTLMMNKILIHTPKIVRQITTAWFELANHLAVIVCFISYEKWVQRDKYLNNTHVYIIYTPPTWYKRCQPRLTWNLSRVLVLNKRSFREMLQFTLMDQESNIGESWHMILHGRDLREAAWAS